MVEVGLLGPVTATVQDRPVRLGPQLQALLAALALETGRVVSSSRLVDLLWPDSPPEAAASTLRSHIQHLRRSLEPDRSAATPRLLMTAPGGYRLQLPAECIDASRFEQGVRAGKQFLVDAQPAQALTRLREALALWRGPALTGITDRPFAFSAAARLDGLRQAAVRARIEAEVALGGHREVLGELRAMLAEEPLDAEIRRLLVNALVHSDRRLEAARVCRDGLVLLHRHGLDPTWLQELQRDVLGAKSAVPGYRTSWPPRPFQLPPDLPEFAGRETEVAMLGRRLRAATGIAILAIDGPPGVGKSTFVNHLAHQVSDDFPDGVLYVDLRGAEPSRLTPLAVLGQFLRTLGVSDPSSSSDTGTAVAAYRSLLADRRMLVVLDNAHDVEQVRPLLPSGARCACLITSRSPLATLDGVESIRLGLLTEDASLALLRRFIGDDRVAEAPAAVAQVAGHCGYLPLALRIAGARLRARPSWSPADLADRLADTHGRLAELAAGDLAVRSSFQLSYQALPPEQRQVFRLLGLLDGPDVSVDVAAALAGTTVTAAAAILDRLADAQILESPNPSRYRFHELMRLFAREQSELEDQAGTRRDALARALAWYTATAANTFHLMAPTVRPCPLAPSCHPPARTFTDRADALGWLETERANLVAAVRQAADHPDPSVAAISWDLSTILMPFLPLGSYADLEAVCEAAIRAGRRFGNRAAVAQALSHLGQIYRVQRRTSEAIRCLDQSLEISRQVGDDHRECITLNTLGRVYLDLGDDTRAATLLRLGLATSRKVENPDTESTILSSLGGLYRTRGQYAAAARLLEESLTLCRAIGGRRQEEETLAELAHVLLEQGRPDEAIDRFQQSLALCRELGDQHDEAMALWGLGRAVAASHGDGAAISYLSTALAIFTAIGAPEAAAVQSLLADTVGSAPGQLLT